MNSTYITLKRGYIIRVIESQVWTSKSKVCLFLIQANVFQSLIISVIYGSFLIR